MQWRVPPVKVETEPGFPEGARVPTATMLDQVSRPVHKYVGMVVSIALCEVEAFETGHGSMVPREQPTILEKSEGLPFNWYRLVAPRRTLSTSFWAFPVRAT